MGYGYINYFEPYTVFSVTQNVVRYNPDADSWSEGRIWLEDLEYSRSVTKVEVFGRKLYTSFGDVGLLKEYNTATGRTSVFIVSFDLRLLT
ncbi:hypothetical protein [Pedobacter ginsengisoli]|uniref:hypothetical protein n=1 Tax=Pedobacter ginsengisoli TaxID=363852 RepID=UPI00254AC0AB|nr:hypothetical protein [Pedobacter ginsengisoli]